MIAALPELIAQTNMDQQSVNRLREELSKFCNWLARNRNTYFLNEYETPSADYTDTVKN
jgi:mortality factor 4-like protein 1